MADDIQIYHLKKQNLGLFDSLDRTHRKFPTFLHNRPRLISLGNDFEIPIQKFVRALDAFRGNHSFPNKTVLEDRFIQCFKHLVIAQGFARILLRITIQNTLRLKVVRPLH